MSSKPTLEKKAVGSFLRECRKEHRMKQDDVAKEAGITQPQLSRIEKGFHSPQLSTLKRLATVLSRTPEEEMAIMQETLYKSAVSMETLKDLSGFTFEEAKERAKNCLDRGRYFEARKYIRAMEQLAGNSSSHLARTELYLACRAKDLGEYELSEQLFMAVPKKLRGEKKDGYNWSMYFLNFADLYCEFNLPELAEMLVKELMTQHREEDFFHCWGLFVEGRISMLNGDVQRAIELFQTTIDKFEKLEDEPPNYVGWFKLFLAKALIKSERREQEGLELLEELMKRWGPEDDPENSEIYAWCAFEYGLAPKGDKMFLERAQRVARRKGYNAILRHIQKEKTETEKKKIQGEKCYTTVPKTVIGVATTVIICLTLFLILSIASPCASVAMSGIKHNVEITMESCQKSLNFFMN